MTKGNHRKGGNKAISLFTMVWMVFPMLFLSSRVPSSRHLTTMDHPYLQSESPPPPPETFWTDLSTVVAWRTYHYRVPAIGFAALQQANETERFIVTGVISGNRHPQRRETIRNTWAKDRSNVFFLVGGNFSSIKKEFQTYQDIIWVDVEEHYHEILYKTTVFFDSAHRSFSYSYLLKTDDDVYIQLPRLTETLQGLESKKDYIGGHCAGGKISRNTSHKRHVTEAEFARTHLPPYHYGVAYVVSNWFNDCLVHAMADKSYMKAEDAFVGILAEQCRIKCRLIEEWSSDGLASPPSKVIATHLGGQGCSEPEIGVLLRNLDDPTSQLHTASSAENKKKCSRAPQQKRQKRPPPRPPPSAAPQNGLISRQDSIYKPGAWDGAPIVLEEFHLVFFTIPKVGCTIWKQLFRRMMGYANWQMHDGNAMPHDPSSNGLKYLYDYDIVTATEFMTSPNWTRAIFTRDPKERFVSAYLDKVLTRPNYLRTQCGRCNDECVQKSKESMAYFVQVATDMCDDPHWRSMARRFEAKFWPYINFVGHLETGQQDAEKLLRKIGAWDSFGKSGWGNGTAGAIFQSETTSANNQGREHATDAKNKMQQYLTPELEAQLDAFYTADYLDPVLNLTNTSIF